MVILQKNIKEIVQKHQNSSNVSKAIKHEKRIKFHVETDIANSNNREANEFLSGVKSLLPRDKYETFLNLFKFPVYTNEITEKIFNQLERVFESKNPFFSYEFTNQSLKIDWDNYRYEVLKEKETWRTRGWAAYQTAINSVLVIDLPEVQKENRPEPYFYWLDISCVLGYELRNDKENFEYIIFKYKNSDDTIAVFDDKYFRVLKSNGNELTSIIEEEHNLGYVPARFFWTTHLKKNTPDLKRSDISNQLSNLDKLLFKQISKDHLDLYASYPIYAAYESDCDYEMTFGEGDSQYTDVCEGGYIKRDGNYVSDGNGLMKCPRCSEKRLQGAGSFIEVPVPSEINNYKDLREPVTITTVNRESLDYNVEEVIRLAESIIINVVGGGGEPSNEQAKNEKQILAGFENKTTILQRIAWNFEKAHKFVNDTICKLRYDGAFIESNISWGKDFYIYSVDELRDIYKKAKENGLSMTELDMIQKQIISTEYRNNPAELKRVYILKDLEPYRHFTLKEIIELKDKGLIVDDQDLQLKLNFTNFIDRFERENINIVEFGNLLEYDKKIQVITNTLKSYGKVREQQSEQV